jgi:hypothetical protein
LSTLEDENNECLSRSSCSLGRSSKQKSSQPLNIKPSLTGSYLIDEELHQVKSIFIKFGVKLEILKFEIILDD